MRLKMTKSSVCSIYADLTKLLQDINKFLEEQVRSGSLKSEVVNEALKLIDRSKLQIERIAPQNDDYVVMHNNVSITEAEDDNEDDDHYALVVETTKKCDVTELPASEVPKISQIKSGPLTHHRRTDRWFFKREQYIKVFGAVYEDHLLIYKNEKSEKPLFCLNLLSYKAQKPANSKKTGAFEVTDKIQSYNFIARDEKDMEQWLSKINKLDSEQERLRPPMTVKKPKMHLQTRPIPDIPQPSQRTFNSDTTYATPGEDYYAMDSQKNNSEDGEYSSVADDSEKREEDEEDDEKIYAIVVPPPASIRPVHSSFIHRQTARR